MRYAAFAVTVLLAALGGAFLIGESLTGPGRPFAVVLAVSWAVVTAGLAAYAISCPDPATRALTALAITVAALIAVDVVFRIVHYAQLGPVGAALALTVATGLGFLGVRRPAPAGRLLLLVGVAALGAGAPGVALAGPVLAAGMLFLLATARRERSPRPREGA